MNQIPNDVFEVNPEWTLRDGICAYAASLGEKYVNDHPTDALAHQFAGHDACHVIFGCTADPVGEAMVSTWIVFGTTMTLRRKLEYFRHPAIRAELRRFGVIGILSAWLRSAPYVARTFVATMRMRSRWDFDGFGGYLGTTVAAIREEYGIAIVTISAGRGASE